MTRQFSAENWSSARVSGAPSQSSHSGPAAEVGNVTKHRRHEPARAGGAESRLNRSAGRRASDSTTIGRGLGLVRNSGTSSPRVSHMSRMVVDSALRIRSSSSLARPLTRPSARACHSAPWCLSRWSLAVGVVSLSRGNGSTWLTSVSSPCSTSRRYFDPTEARAGCVGSIGEQGGQRAWCKPTLAVTPNPRWRPMEGGGGRRHLRQARS
ncbi:Uncharacterised protein [Mycobacteroides abscessus subsp. abscessus]|nr:Uncharacterised protein [Mycobacteroides abscessus subsp. abscessus]